ncbi:MAG: hypothetical protein IKQ31_05525 [Clostridia bacterium]|nr:hypothetical protein [Clostridia bacterium]
MEELSRKYAVTMAEINTWRDEFIQNGTDGFKRKPEDSKLSRAERKIGQLEQEIELIMCPTAKRCKKKRGYATPPSIGIILNRRIMCPTAKIKKNY